MHNWVFFPSVQNTSSSGSFNRLLEVCQRNALMDLTKFSPSWRAGNPDWTISLHFPVNSLERYPCYSETSSSFWPSYLPARDWRFHPLCVAQNWPKVFLIWIICYPFVIFFLTGKYTIERGLMRREKIVMCNCSFHLFSCGFELFNVLIISSPIFVSTLSFWSYKFDAPTQFCNPSFTPPTLFLHSPLSF